MLKQLHYLYLTVFFLVVEICIALFFHDRFIRPIFGDYLIVFLVYCGLKTVIKFKPITAIIITILFAYAVEITQYINILKILNIQPNLATKLILGSSFEWVDMLAYTLGVLTIYYIEYNAINKKSPK
ncbi:hypothetical protein NBRC110019_08400 [Neptunitalea chrysea]|uniref:DUF2809 domain-containing protein n=1 Tax=Neptunitalea chrysea TaxID=1647581 RepID=A0A9W6EUJ3_9FLAO|nr:DUF2809 domain-containing protein [Neptunitalea chrysea]GLB51801.1 hypothetical protein NBRC110019_08400 [Neptunitalea chrysea]